MMTVGRYEKISRRLNATNFYDFMNRDDLSYNEMLGLIDYGVRFGNIPLVQKVHLKQLLQQKQCLFKLTATKIGVISDTHIGNDYMNWDYIHKAYHLFGEEGVNDVFHLGDLFDGYSTRDYSDDDETHNELLLHCYRQIMEFAKEYPKDFDTYILFGNHDERFEQIGIDIWSQLLAKRDDIQLLGYGGSYVSCNDTIFYLEHPVKCSTLIPPKFNFDLILRGHSHFFRYKPKQDTLTVTTCSDLKTRYGTLDTIPDPGCAIISFTDDCYNIDGYTFVQDNIEKPLTLTLKKKR